MPFGDFFGDLAVDLGLVEDRAGRYARSLARGRHMAFLEASWRRLIIPFVLAMAAVGLTVFLPRWARAFVAGAWIASIVWTAVFVVVQGSGTSPITMGASAERWTAQELRKLRRLGWRFVSHVMPSYGDVDHIAVGPGGLIVAETKWVSDASRPTDEEWLARACNQVLKNARDIRLALKARLRDAPIHIVVVYWGCGQERRPMELSGVTVLPGAALPSWLDSISTASGGQMTAADIESSWKTLAHFAAQTDRRELGDAAHVSRAPARRLVDATTGIVSGLAFFVISFVALRWLGAGAFGPAFVLAGVGAVLYRRTGGKAVTSVSMLELGMVVGTSTFIVLAGALYSYLSLVRR